ncbi:MAG: tape measure protein [Salana multivorans]|nr:tape measure protein [Salana multivorans]
MALTVGELVAYIRADGAQFDRQIDDSGKKFSGLRSLVASGTKVLAGAFAGVTTAAVGLGAAVFKIGFDYNRLQQTSRAALTTLLGSAEAANAQMDKLDEFAKSSPFAKQVFITAQQQLLGFGVAADKVLPTLDAIQNAVAAVGGSNDDISELTRIIAQVQSSGKITAETLNQLGARGVDGATLIGSAMGKTGQQIRESITEGSLGAEEAIDALVAGMTARFNGATANIKQQYDGALDRVKGATRDIGSIMAAPFVDPNGGGRAVEWANKFADALRALEQKAKPLVDLLVQRFKPGFDAVTPALDKARGAINAWDLSKVNGQLDTLTKYAPLVAPLSAALFALGTTNLPILSTFGLTGLNPVVAGIGALIAASPQLRAAGGEFFQALSPLLPVVTQIGKALADSLIVSLDVATPAIRDLLLAGADLAVTLGTTLGPAIVSLVEALVPLVSVGANVVSWVTDLPAPLLAAVAAFTLFKALGLAESFQGASDAAAGFVSAIKNSDAARAYQAGLSPLSAGLVGVNSAATAASAGIGKIGLALKTAFLANPIGLAITAITTALTYFATKQAEARQRSEEFQATLDQTTSAITEQTRALVREQLLANNQYEYMIGNAETLGYTMRDLIDIAVDPTSEATARLTTRMGELKDYLGTAEANWQENKEATEAARLELRQYNSILEVLGPAIDGVSNEVEDHKQKQRDIAVALGDTTGKTQGQADALKELTDAQREAAGASISLREAQLQAEDQQQRFTEAVAQSAKVNADAEASEEAKAAAVRDVEQALLTTVRGYQQTTDAMGRNNASAEELDATIKSQRDQFIQNAIQMGYNRDEARKLADSYGLIPNRVMTELIAEAAAAQRTIDGFITSNTGRRIKVWVDAQGGATYQMAGSSVKFNRDGGMLEFFASGAMRSLTPMSSVAQIVGANTWRVIGDRPRGDEAYIPIENTARSHAIFDETARRLGRFVLPMDAGGVLAQSPSAAAVPSNPAVVPTVLAPESVRHLARELAQVAAGLSQAAVAGAARSAGSERATRGTAW